MKKLCLIMSLMCFIGFTNIIAQNDPMICTPTGMENVWNG